MSQEKKTQKKVDYSIMSNKECKVCGKPLKQNVAIKGFTLCYVCFKISKGKFTANKSIKDDFGNVIRTIKIDFKKKQAINIKKYKGGVV